MCLYSVHTLIKFVFVCQSLKMLDDEETTDNELRAKFNQRWNRTPSGDLYKPLRTGTHPLLAVVWFLIHRFPASVPSSSSPS